jgi:hypothetical protein
MGSDSWSLATRFFSDCVLSGGHPKVSRGIPSGQNDLREPVWLGLPQYELFLMNEMTLYSYLEVLVIGQCCLVTSS